MVKICALLLLLFSTVAQAQNGIRPPRGWSLGMAAGGSAFTAMHRSSDVARLSPHTSGVFTGSLSWWGSPNWGLRVLAAQMPTRFAEIGREEAIRDDTITYAPLTIRSAHLQLNFRMPTIHNRIMPYGVLGAGMSRFAAGRNGNPIPAEAQVDFATGSRTVPAATVGIGARLHTRRNGWALNFELLDQIARTPLRSSLNNEVTVTNAATFTVGLSWTLYSH